MSQSKSRKFFDFGLVLPILSLAGPTMLEELAGTLVQYIDTAMVGSLGMMATAAVGSTTTINWLVGSTTHAFGVGFLSYIARKIGAGEMHHAKRASAQSVFVTIITGLFFTALTLGLAKKIPVWMQVDESARETAYRYFFIIYTPMLFRAAATIFSTILRGAGDSRTPMRVCIAMNIVNVVGNFLLIYAPRQVQLFGITISIWGAGWGVIGAAVATAVSYAVGGIAITIALFRHKDISPSGCSLKPDWVILKPCMQIAFPNMLQRFCTSLGYVVFAGMINALGAVSTAAHTIANTVESAFYIPGYGMQSAAATLTGNAIGAQDETKRKALARMIVLLEICMMILSGGLLFFFAPQMVGLFSADATVILLGSRVLKMVACSEPFYGVSIVTEGMLIGAGKTQAPFIFSVSCMWGLRILGTFLCTHVFGMGLTAAWACMIANNLALMLALRIYYRKTF